MAITESSMMKLGTKAPDFTLLDTVSDNERNLKELKSDKATVIMFICNHCPFVKHVISGIVKVANDYIPKGVAFIAISSNDVIQFPADGTGLMRETAQKYKFPFVYLFDETQEVAKAYDAVCTPDFFIFDSHMNCVYRGQLDDSRPGNDMPVNGKDIRAALDAILAGDKPSEEQKPSMGCNIKWR